MGREIMADREAPDLRRVKRARRFRSLSGRELGYLASSLGGKPVSQHPLIELANDREVRQSKGFREAAARLTGEALAEMYQQEVANAPKRSDAGKKFLTGQTGTALRGRKSSRPTEELSVALVNQFRDRSEGLDLPTAPAGDSLDSLAYQVPLKNRQSDPDKRIGKIDLIAAVPDDRLTIAILKYVPPTATRGSTGDTPLRALLEGLAYTAIVQANRSEILGEIEATYGRKLSEEPPVLVILGNSRYWELCRKREAQKGAAWINQMERLAQLIDENLGIGVRYLSIKLQDDPGWSIEEERPTLVGTPILDRAWGPGAGKVKPKPRPKSKSKAAAIDEIVEADPSRPVRRYQTTDSYTPGDSIDHPTLGIGVVQRSAGAGKIKVLFDDTPRLLIHERGSAAS